MRGNSLPIRPLPSELPSAPVGEFIEAFQLAMGIAAGKFASIHARSKGLCGPTTRNPMGQLSLVLGDRYGKDQRKIVSILLRVVALEKLLQDARIKHWTCDDEGNEDRIEVNESVFEVAATIQLNDDGTIDEDMFFLSLSRKRLR